MAADRFRQVLEAQPEGPYRLCGYCASGLVAFEVARMLTAAGKKVEMVGLIDPPTVNARKSVQLFFSTLRRARPLAGALADNTVQWTFRALALSDKFRNLPAPLRRDFLKQKAKLAFARVSRSAEVDGRQPERDKARRPGSGAGPVRHWEDERNPKYAKMVWNYLPRSLAARVVYFSVEYGAGAWRRLSPDLEVIRLPGAHGDIDLAALAEHLRSLLR